MQSQVMNPRSLTTSIACLCLLAVAKTASAVGVTVPLDSFAVFSSGGLSIANTTETTIGGHDWITGNIGSNRDVFMQGNPLPGYPAQLDGSAYAGGNLEFGQDLTVGNSGGPQREVIA